MTKNTPNEHLHIFQERISTLIDKCSLDNSEIKILLNHLFENLTNYTIEQFRSLQKEQKYNFINQENTPRNLWKIYTALRTKTNNNDYGEFKPILPKPEKLNFYSDYNANFLKSNRDIGIFFNCSYDKFLKITDYNNKDEYFVKTKNGNHEKILSFHFERSNVFVYAENILHKIAVQYGYNYPLIYSPYSRRFAYVIFSEPETNIENITKDFFSDCEFYDAIEATTHEKTLVWNIWISNTDLLQEETTIISDNISLQNATIKSTFQCSENQYINFESFSKNKLEIQRITENQNNQISEKKVKITVLHNNEIDLVHSLITIYKFSELEDKKFDPTQIFQNYYSPSISVKQRVYSYADISYVINGFNWNPYGIEINTDDIKIYSAEKNVNFQKFIVNNQDDFITEYNTSDRYYEYMISRSETYRTIKTTPKAYCVLIFDKTADFNGNINFIEDYARYVLSYLNEKYPEFGWKGKKGWLE